MSAVQVGVPDTEKVTPQELVSLCALDSNLYCRHFFPGTFRQKTPLFHSDIWNLLEDRSHRHVALEVFRGGAKTTTLRAYTSKRVAYAISRTILFVSASQEHSKKSLAWLRKQVEKNVVWSFTYGLQRGSKWSDEAIEIYHSIFDVTITILAVGITGQIRGINIDDYRPDLIVADDPCDEENSGSPEQRAKTSDLFFGALEKSLAPRSESPDSKMVLLQTSLDKEDLVNTCHLDQSWATRKYPVFDENGRSIWPDRFPTSELIQEKQSYVDKNILRTWLREMECTVMGGELADLRPEWLQYYNDVPEKMVVFLGVDPVPPPSDKEIERGFARKDFECLAAVGKINGKYYVLEIASSRGHQPDWTITKFFEMVDRWQPLRVRLEGIAYQKTLRWVLEQEMQKRGRFIQINLAPDDKRSKRHRILQAFSGIGSQKRFYVRRDMMELIQQWGSYPYCSHDDHLDAVAMATTEAMESRMELDYEPSDLIEAGSLDIRDTWRAAP